MPRDDANVNQSQDVDARQAPSAAGSVDAQGRADEATPQPGDDRLPPPSSHRADTMVRAVSPEARQEMARDNNFGDQPSFTKGDNAQTIDQSRYPYTVEEMDTMLDEARRPIFPDTPGGDGAKPLSADRETFLTEMGNRGRFPSQRETERWARAVFNVLRERAIVDDEALASEYANLVRFGEAPEVQVQEMMWAGDFVDRWSRSLAVASSWSREEFYRKVADEGGTSRDDPWVDAAVFSFFGTLKLFDDDVAGYVNLGELQEIWDKA